MAEKTILVPKREVLEGREFYANTKDEALKNCQDEGYRAVFMPSIVDSRIEAEKGDRVWQTFWHAPSIKATGRTKDGNAVVVYAHIQNYFSDPKNIAEAKKKLVNGAEIMPQEEFQRLYDLRDGENVFVVDYDVLKNSLKGVIPLKDALKHPQTIPFVGGRERAEQFLDKHNQVYGDKIGVWHTDDLGEKPLGRWLYLGDYYGLNGNNNLYFNGRLLGVRAESAPQKIITPTRDQLTRIVNEEAVDFIKSIDRRVSALE